MTQKRGWKGFSLLLLTSLHLTSCGYQWGPDFPNGERPTIAVPYIQGDLDGQLTAEVMRALSSSGLARIQSHDADYRLLVTLQGTENSVVGYRYDRQKTDGKISKNIVADEGRKTIQAEAALYSGEEIVYGPFQVGADADYDYIDGDAISDLLFTNSTGIPTTVLPFSLGQLEPIEAAQEATNRPLYTKIAQNIVDAIFAAW